MRATAILLCLVASVANAQPAEAPQARPEELLTPPPITSASPDEPLPAQAPAPSPSPEDEFIAPPFAPAPAAEPTPPPQAAPKAPSPSPAPQAVSPAPSPPPPPRASAAPSEPAWNPPPRSTGPAERPAQRALRYSRYSAGPGGSALVITEGMAGIVTGAMMGSAFDIASDSASSDGYTGAIVGGLSLGTLATLYQYFFPVGRHEGLLVAGAATAGLMASLTIANSRDLNSRDRAVLTFASTQAAVIGVLMLTAGGEDVSSGDMGLIGSMSVYGFVVAGLVEYIHAKETGQHYNATPMLVAPAVGMALGGLLSIPLELSTSSAFDVTMYPLGAGLIALGLGTRLADEVVVAKTVLGTVAATYLIVSLAHMLTPADEEVPQRTASTFQAVPVPVVMSAGRGNDSLAAGAGLFMRF